MRAAADFNGCFTHAGVPHFLVTNAPWRERERTSLTRLKLVDLARDDRVQAQDLLRREQLADRRVLATQNLRR